MDDLIPTEGAIPREALTRLSQQEQHDRLFRFRRALNLSLHKVTLSPDQWTTEAEDVPYLTPHIKQVEAEVQDKEHYDQMTNVPKELLKRNRV